MKLNQSSLFSARMSYFSVVVYFTVDITFVLGGRGGYACISPFLKQRTGSVHLVSKKSSFSDQQFVLSLAFKVHPAKLICQILTLLKHMPVVFPFGFSILVCFLIIELGIVMCFKWYLSCSYVFGFFFSLLINYSISSFFFVLLIHPVLLYS